MAKTEAEQQRDRTMKKLLLIINCVLLSIGTSGGPLIMRLYFLRGGHHVWLSAFLETASFPVMLLPLAISYLRRRRHATTATAKPNLISMKLPLFLASAVVGILTGLDDYLYAYGVARLPVSTSALIIATQLAFTALFPFLLVKQKFTSYSVNAVVLLTVGAGVLALSPSYMSYQVLYFRSYWQLKHKLNITECAYKYCLEGENSTPENMFFEKIWALHIPSKSNVQSSRLQCGFYVMQWMKQIIRMGLTDSWAETFNHTESFAEEAILHTRKQWTSYLLVCKDIDEDDSDS